MRNGESNCFPSIPFNFHNFIEKKHTLLYCNRLLLLLFSLSRVDQKEFFHLVESHLIMQNGLFRMIQETVIVDSYFLLNFLLKLNFYDFHTCCFLIAFLQTDDNQACKVKQYGPVFFLTKTISNP